MKSWRDMQAEHRTKKGAFIKQCRQYSTRQLQGDRKWESLRRCRGHPKPSVQRQAHLHRFSTTLRTPADAVRFRFSCADRPVPRVPYPLLAGLTGGSSFAWDFYQVLGLLVPECLAAGRAFSDRNCPVCLLGHSCFVPLTEQVF
jgi:hypothetical protein